MFDHFVGLTLKGLTFFKRKRPVKEKRVIAIAHAKTHTKASELACLMIALLKYDAFEKRLKYLKEVAHFIIEKG